MPRLPPTPGSSTDIKGQDGTRKLAPLQMAFELPPPALHDPARTPPAESTKLSPTSPSSAYPMQAAETVKSRRRSSAQLAKDNGNNFALPPPPTRSRKIIQMKPPQDEVQEPTPASATKSKNGKSGKGASVGATASTGNTTGGTGQQGKKKQPSATSAAGRKIARKTAHSLIERRRRSKMNEEFALLKSMIPACTGEMHKLAILQASIEYVRYLEDCVSKLKAQHEDDQSRAQLPSIREFHPTFRDDVDDDVEMTDTEAVSPTNVKHQPPPQAYPEPSRSHQPSVSPALYAQDARQRQHSYSSVSTDHYRHYSYSASETTSPAFGPQAGYAHSNAGSALTSPALNPQSDLDQEATAALLMLNNDRRGYAATNGYRSTVANNRKAVSVRDLLTS